MKRFALVAMVALMAGLYVAPVVAQNFSIHGEVRTRGEFQSNILDFQDHPDPDVPGLDDDFDLWPYRVRIAAFGEFSDNVSAMIDLQNNGFFGSSFIGPNQSPGDPVLQAIRGNFGTSETVLYQGYIDVKEVGGSAFNFRIGRQEHTLGNELHMGDLDFYNGTSFDGIRAYWNFEQWNLNAFYYNVQEASLINLAGPGRDGDDDIIFTGATADFEIASHGQRVEPYLLLYHDGGSPISVLPDARFWTVGAQYGREANSRSDVSDLAWDWSIEAAFQTGDFIPTATLGPVPDIDQGGNIVEGWLGYNWNHGSDSRSRVHLGFLQASGDDDATDTDNDAFFPLFPDNHSRNRLGNMDLFGSPLSTAGIATGSPTGGISNITDINVGYEWWGKNGKHYFMAAIHDLSLAEDICVSASSVVALLTPAGCPVGFTSESDLGMEVDLEYNYNYSNNLSLQVGIATLLVDDLIDRLVPDGPGIVDGDDALRIWGQARIRF